MALTQNNPAGRTLSDQFRQIVIRNNVSGRFVSRHVDSPLLKRTTTKIFVDPVPPKSSPRKPANK